MFDESPELDGWDDPAEDLQEPTETPADKRNYTKSMRRLTPQQENFLRAYIANGFNGTKAAHEAGYGDPNNPRSAQDDASKLLARDYIKARLDELLAESRKRYAIEQDDLVQKAAQLMNESKSEKIQIDAVKLLMQVKGMLTEKREVKMDFLKQLDTLSDEELRRLLSSIADTE